MISDALLLLLREFGPLLGLILFFVWRDWKREDKLAARVEALEAYQRDTLVGLLRETTISLTQNGECLKWIGRIVEKVCGKCPRWELVPEQPEGTED